MPEQQGSEGQPGPEGGAEGYKPPATQADLDKIVGERVARERAKYADYDDLKTQVANAAAEADKTKTAEQKLNDRIAALEKDNAAKTTDALRARVARQHGITDDKQVELYLTGSTEEVLTEQAKGLRDLIAARKRAGGHVPGEGTSSSATGNSDRQVVSALFGGGD